MKKKWLDICHESLTRYRREGDRFLGQNVTGDELWIHHYDSESKRAPVEFKHCYTGKVELKTFWDAGELVYTEFVQEIQL